MSTTRNNSLINGVPAGFLDVNDRAIHYGDGLFETILCSNNKIFYWEQHYLRLLLSSNKLNILCPEEQLLLDDIRSLLQSVAGAETGGTVIKIIMTRGAGERGYKYDRNHNTNRIVFASPIDNRYSSILSKRLLSGELVFCRQQVSINENLAGMKHLNRLENILARNEWQDSPEIIDGLMLNADGFVIEGSMSNLFAVSGEQLLTPSLDRSGVRGVMRDVIIGIAKANAIEVSCQDIMPGQLAAMDELFISNSLIGMKSVNRLRDTSYRKTDVTKLIFEKLLQTGETHAQVI